MEPARSRQTSIPRIWGKDLEHILLREEQIQRRVRQLARSIEREYKGRELVVVALLNGTVLFLADLIRQIRIPLRLDFMGVSSYRLGQTPGELVFTKDLKLDVKGRDVLLVDDILDTGRTLKRVTAKLKKLRPRSLKICVFLEKKARREEKIAADYVGFQIPDLFVVGYGLDYAEGFRNLPFVGVLQDHVYSTKRSL